MLVAVGAGAGIRLHMSDDVIPLDLANSSLRAQVGEARRGGRLAHVGGEGAPDAFGATVLLALLQETPRPRLPGLGGPRHATIEEGGCYRTFDAAGHRDSPEVAPPGPREGSAGLARFY